MRPTHRRPALAFDTARSIFGYPLAILLLLLASSPAAGETPRERCRILTARGPRAAAIAACDEAVALRASAEDLWAAAEVRVARPEAPTMDDLIRADLLAAAAARLAPNEPWGELARFELARRWGDPELVAKRLAALERVAPNHPRTLEAAALARPRSGAYRVLGWCALFLVCALTLAHALRRKLGHLQRARLPGALLALIAASLLTSRPALAAFPIDDADPERGVPAPAAADARPLDFAYYLQDLTARAEAASRRGDQAAAVRYFRALARAVPDSSVPQQKLCAALVTQGKRDGAIEACRAALALPGVRAQDFQRFAELVLEKPAPSPGELRDVEAVARHLSEQPDTRDAGLQLQCRVKAAQGQRVDARRPRLVIAGVGVAGMLLGVFLLLRSRRTAV